MLSMTTKESAAVPIEYGDITSPEGREMWAEHWNRVENDPGLDADTRHWLQDPTLWTIADASSALGFGGSQRVWILRNPNMDRRRPHPHPHRMTPDVETVGRVADRDQPGFAAGLVRLWALQRGTHVLNRVTGELIKGVRVLRDDTGEYEIGDRRAASGTD